MPSGSEPMNNQTDHPAISNRWVKPVSVFALIFGLMTVFSGGSVLFGPAEARVWAGSYIQFVVWFNFLAGFAYVLAAIGLWQRKCWAPKLAGLIAGATAAAALGFSVVVLQGGAFEMRTVGALAFRFAFWAAIAVFAHRAMRTA